MNDRLREELLDLAESHQPDRAAIASRVAARRTAQRRRRQWLPLTAAAGVASVVAVSVAAAQADESVPPPVAASSPSAVTSAPPTPPPPSSSPPKSPVRTAKPTLAATGKVAEQSVATWTQNTVTVRNTKAVKGFRLVVTVPMTPGLTEAGRYATVPNADLTMDVTRGGDALVYTYALKKGLILRPGTYEFGAQFTHRSGRSGRSDGFQVTAQGADLAGTFRSR